jgi:hypothetical protein
LFLFLIQLENVKFNQKTIKFTIKYCLNILSENKIDDFYKQILILIFPYLLSYLKVKPDKEYKINTTNRRTIIASKIFWRLETNSIINTASSDGLILAWNSFEPNLKFIYESWLLSIRNS